MQKQFTLFQLTTCLRWCNMDLYDIRITLDPDYPDKVEIEMLENGVGVEGGQFDLGGLIQAIKEFYNKNY